MSKVHQLREVKAELGTKIKAMADEFNKNEKQWQDADQEAAFIQLNADYDANDKALAQAEKESFVVDRLAFLADSGEQGAPVSFQAQAHKPRHTDSSTRQERYGKALAAWLRGPNKAYDMNDADKAACHEFGINPLSSEFGFNSLGTGRLNGLRSSYVAAHPSQSHVAARKFFNAPLDTGVPSSGGDAVPDETLLREMEIAMLDYSGMAQVSDMIVTSGGEPLSWPTVDDTANKGVLVAENANLDNSGSGGAIPTFGKVTWGAYKFSSEMILVPYEMLQDSVVDLPAVLGRLIGERIGRARNDFYTNGTGTAQPLGILNAATLGVTAASATAITGDEILALQHSVDPAYRRGAVFMAHDQIILQVRTLKDSNGQYLWASGLNSGVQDTLAGSPIVPNQDMPSALATTNKTMTFGDHSKYKIRRVQDMRMYRLQERYRDFDQDGFILLLREDGNLLDAGVAPVKYLQQG